MKAAKPFFFKEFKLEQEGAAMKVNTDGVLLGALASHQFPRRVLDVGTGTGVIALMMAQRFPEAIVDALEPDPTSHLLAVRNFLESPFSSRLTVWPDQVEHFKAEGTRFDLIVSNPPYFLNALKNDLPSKAVARHTDQRFFSALFDQSLIWLKPDGALQLIVPFKLSALLIEMGERKGFQAQLLWEISSFPAGKIIRCILRFSRTGGADERQTAYLYEERGVYSPFYRELLAPYFLNF